MKFNYLLSIYNPPITAVPRCQTQQLKGMTASHGRANFLVLLVRNGSRRAYPRVKHLQKGSFAGTQMHARQEQQQPSATHFMQRGGGKGSAPRKRTLHW